MPVYARRLNGAQRRLLGLYEAMTGVEPLGQDDLDAGEITFSDVWKMNVHWLEGVLADVINLDRSGTGL